MTNIDTGSDPQDRAEVLDETNLTEDAGLRTAPEDRSFAADEDRVTTEDERSRNYEASGGTGDKDDKTSTTSDPGEDAPDEKDEHVDKQLDKGLKETFPASDPVSINPGAD